MLPVLLDLKIVKIYTYGVFLILAFFWGAFVLWRNIRLTSHKEEEIFDGLFLSLAGGLIVGRLVYVLFNFKQFGLDPVKFILVNGYPGISLYGGLLGALSVSALFFYSKKINVRQILDYFISPLLLALAFGKLGSFFSGAEIGTRTKFPLAIKYAGFEGLRHLTPLYESLAFFFGAYIAYRLIFEIRKEKYAHGFLFIFFIWYFSLVYFLFDKFIDNPLYFLGQRFNLMVSTILLLTSSLYFLYYFRSVIRHFILTYGQKAIQNIHFRQQRKTRKGEGKNSQTG